MSDENELLRRIERAELRINEAEKSLSAVTSELRILREDLHRRIVELKSDLIAKSDDHRDELRDRIDVLKQDLSDNISGISATMHILNDNVTQTSESVQNLYATQKSSSVKVNTNEKIIWAVIGLLGTAGLYLLQEFLRRGGS